MYECFRMASIIMIKLAVKPLRQINSAHFSNEAKYPSVTSAEYCMNLVKKHDYENFISTLLLKDVPRSCGFAVRSFNVEIARIAEQVSQKDIGLMRFQFWEDTLDKCYLNEFDKVPRHPVAVELFKSIQKHKLSKRNLKNLINCRKQHLNLTGFNSLEDMEKYAESSVSSVYYSVLEACGIRNIHVDHAASHLGKAQGIVQQLRSIPLSKSLNFIPLPQNVLSKNNVSHEELLRCKPSKPLSDCVYELASRAHQHLAKARSLRESVPLDGRQAFLPAVTIFTYLDRLQKVDYNVFDLKLQQRQWNLLIKMWLNSVRNTY